MKRILWSAILLLIPAGLYARWGYYCQDGGYIPGRGYWMGGNFFGGGIFMFIVTLLIIGFLVFFTYQYAKNKKILDVKGDSAFDIARTRYAKGEITKKEFETIRADLK